MLYVKSKKSDVLGIFDTDDNTLEYYALSDVLALVKTGKLEINGVDSAAGQVCTVVLFDDTRELVKRGKFNEALSSMLIHSGFGVIFTKRAGEFVENKTVNIYRNGFDDFSFDFRSSKSYRSGLTLKEMHEYLGSYFRNYQIKGCTEGRF